MTKPEKQILEMANGEKITLTAFLLLVAVVGVAALGLLGMLYLMYVSPENLGSPLDMDWLTKGMG